jgi:hypothetical protein
MTVRSAPDTVTAGSAWLAVECNADFCASSHGLPVVAHPRTT